MPDNFDNPSFDRTEDTWIEPQDVPQDTPWDIPQDTAPAYTPDTTDSIYTYWQDVQSIMGGMSTPGESFDYGGAGMSRGDYTQATGSGQATPEKGALDWLLDKGRATFGFPDTEKGKTEFGKLAATGTALAISGLGQGYMANQKLAQDKKLAEDKLAIDRQLVDSQTAINDKKMKNQDFSNFNFKPPTKGLINGAVKFNPTYRQGG